MHNTLPSLSVSRPRVGPATGSVIGGRFAVGDLLGKGGRGEVYRAVQIDLAREVALKLLSDVGDADAHARFLQEARVAASVRHPCVAEVFDAGVAEDGTPYCAMELLEGESLAARMEREGALDPSLVVTVAAGVCSALGAVHDKGIVHRDVKPSNIFLARRPDGGVDPKLVDFGIAKRVSLPPETVRRVTLRYGEGQKTPVPTAVNVIIGTPRYLSPEQILGHKVDARSDVWALAATLYEALGGAPAFAGATLSELLEKIVVEDPLPLASLGVAPPLAGAVMRGLSKDPAARFATAADLSTALWEAMAEARHGRTSSPIPVPPLPVQRYDRWLLGAAVVVGVAVVAVTFGRSGPPAPSAAAPSAISPASPPVAAPLPAATAATSDPEGASTAAPASAPPGPRARGAHPKPPREHAPPAATTAPAATTSFKVDDLKTPF
jgi:eukaryotic-like serine/threonine-protein kinase